MKTLCFRFLAFFVVPMGPLFGTLVARQDACMVIVLPSQEQYNITDVLHHHGIESTHS